MKAEQFLDGKVLLYSGDMLKVVPTLKANSIDSVCTDPPYHLVSIVKRFGQPNSAPVKLKKIAGQSGSPFERGARGFMGKAWDGGDVAFRPETWREIWRVLKPGGHVLAFGGTRTFGRMQVALEDAGFEIRDAIAWLYGSGFPKSHDVSKHIDAKLMHGKTSTRQLRKVNAERPGQGKVGGRLPNAGIMSGNRLCSRSMLDRRSRRTEARRSMRSASRSVRAARSRRADARFCRLWSMTCTKAPRQMVMRKAMISVGTARRSVGSAVNSL